jgi:UDP-hydrolysing UDP-N-acetyl-D-glucosamine 2-epimerase
LRTIGVVTVGRSDYGIFLPVLREISGDPDLKLCLMATGMHLSPEFGLTVEAIENDGFNVDDRIEMLLSSDSPEGVAKSMGLGIIGFAQAYSRFQPDILLVLGDRFETLAAVTASLPYQIPVAHIHGGESTEGLIDEPIRHAITKMSHLHFTSMEGYAERVIQMGEEPWRVVVSGAPALDNLLQMDLLSQAELVSEHGLNMARPTLLVTYHPVTLDYEQTGPHMSELLTALAVIDMDIIFTYPNADTRSRVIIDMVQEFVNQHDRAKIAVNLGTRAYSSVMKYATAMVGNSSSGIIEAASFELPVVNIGDRQQGRAHGENVIDVGDSAGPIQEAIRIAVSPYFRAGLSGMTNPYGDGHAAAKIVEVTKKIPLDRNLLQKRFYETGVKPVADPISGRS